MTLDHGHAGGALAAGAGIPLPGDGRATTLWRVERWGADATRWATLRLDRAPTDRDFARLRVAPYAVTEHLGNVLCTAGWTRLLNLAGGLGGQAYDNTHTRIGVGNGTVTAGGGSVPAVAADTDLAAASGAANRWFQLVTASTGGPTVGGTVPKTLTYVAVFGGSDGNFAWNEMGLDAGTASGATVTAPLLNHATSIAQGTKAAGQTWTATATLSFT
ncbi:hypothetical protein ACG83_10720 [Frankia sp. R43]|uniref:hypothetical protein n=1 Tax=Frankia sp. R43 TaxID=269536 RepID=UPI0006C9F569|nr:hypothetical protein [Frankia sp. R43]KPM55742.1 hypothetical protein ACG83_10720 [Frankia sp. R43]